MWHCGTFRFAPPHHTFLCVYTCVISVLFARKNSRVVVGFFFFFTFSGRSGQIDDHVHLPLRLQVDLQRQRRGRNSKSAEQLGAAGGPSLQHKQTHQCARREVIIFTTITLGIISITIFITTLISVLNTITSDPISSRYEHSVCVCDLDEDFFWLSAFSVVSILLLWCDHNV